MAEWKIFSRSFIATADMAGLSMILDWGKINALSAKIKPKKDHLVVIIGAGRGSVVERFWPNKVSQLRLLNNTISREDTQHHLNGPEGKFTFDVSLHRISVSRAIIHG